MHTRALQTSTHACRVCCCPRRATHTHTHTHTLKHTHTLIHTCTHAHAHARTWRMYEAMSSTFHARSQPQPYAAIVQSSMYRNAAMDTRLSTLDSTHRKPVLCVCVLVCVCVCVRVCVCVCVCVCSLSRAQQQCGVCGVCVAARRQLCLVPPPGCDAVCRASVCPASHTPHQPRAHTPTCPAAAGAAAGPSPRAGTAA
jgi:hypothetical protein